MRASRPESGVRRALAFAALAAIAIWATGCGQQMATAEIETHAHEVLIRGTVIVAALQGPLDTGKIHIGDKIVLRTVEDVRISEATVVPAGTTINGEVSYVDPAGRVAGGAELTLRFTGLVMPDGTSYVISAVPLRLEGKGDAKESAIEFGGGAFAGGVLGGRDEFAKGAAVGAVVGTAVAVATKGDQIVLPVGQKMSVSLLNPISIETKSRGTS